MNVNQVQAKGNIRNPTEKGRPFMNEITERIKSFFLENDVSVFGIAQALSLESDPAGYRPSDMLPGARSILCMGLPFAKGIFTCRGKAEQMYWRAAAVYYRHIDATMLKAAALIEEQGETAVPVFGCFPYDVPRWGDFWGYLSLAKAGEAVGIGKLGKNGLLFNTLYGPRLLLGGLITTASLTPMSFPEKDDQGCPADCFVCQERCPAQAIDKDGKVDRVACLKHSMKSPLFSHMMRTLEPPPEDVQMINHVTGVDDHSWYTCIECVSTCPHL
jgi:epoxyqueuosine reductase